MTQCTVATVSAMGRSESGLFGISQPGPSPDLSGPASDPSKFPMYSGTFPPIIGKPAPTGYVYVVNNPEELAANAWHLVPYPPPDGSGSPLPIPPPPPPTTEGPAPWYLSPWVWVLVAGAGWFLWTRQKK